MTEQEQAAMKLALEALEAINTEFVCQAAHHSKKEQHSYFEPCPNVARHDKAITALRQALEQPAAREPLTDEPVAWLTQAKCLVSASDFQRKDAELYGWKALYTRPQPAAWVGLTDEEIEKLLVDAKFTRTDLMMIGACVEDICKMVQAKLKEKNGDKT